MPFNQDMRFLRAILSLVATLVVVSSPIVSRASVTHVADATVTLGVGGHANGSLAVTSHDAGAPIHEASDVPAAPADDADRDTSLLDGGDSDALPIQLDVSRFDDRALAVRIMVVAQSAPESRAPETSPRPPRV
jgi:hypothetical protein